MALAKPETAPLDAAELAELERLLEVEVEPHGGVSIEYLDGLLAGIVCCPDRVDPEQWLEFVFGLELGETVAERLEFRPELKPLLPLIRRHHAAVADALSKGRLSPILRDSPSNGPPKGPPGRAWARSFLTALTSFGGTKWRKISRLPEYEMLLEVVVELALDGEPGPNGRRKSLTAKKRARLVEMLELATPALAVAATLSPKKIKEIALLSPPPSPVTGKKPARATATKSNTKAK